MYRTNANGMRQVIEIVLPNRNQVTSVKADIYCEAHIQYRLTLLYVI